MHLTLIILITVQTTLVQRAWNSNASFSPKNQRNLTIRPIRDSDKMNVNKILPSPNPMNPNPDNFEMVLQAQALNYLKAYKLEVGLLINFGETKLKFHRLENKKFGS